MKIERRFIPQVEVRVAENESGPLLEGYTAKFNSWSEDLGGFRETIQPGAFKKTLKEADVRALFNHDSNFILGRNTAGTLRLKEDDAGLFYQVDLDTGVSYVNDLMRSVKRGDITGNSFAFRTVKDRWTQSEDRAILDERELLEVELFDVGPVVYPAYPDTSVGVRSNEFVLEEKWQKLNGLMFRLHQGGKVKDSDLEFVQSCVDELRELMPAQNSTAIESHSVTTTTEIKTEPIPVDHSEVNEPIPVDHSAFEEINGLIEGEFIDMRVDGVA